MSVYDSRKKPAYDDWDAPLNLSENPFILKWWKKEHDEIIRNQIIEEHWNWAWGITEEITSITPKELIEQWKREDELCSKYAWYNVLMYFAVSRAKRLGFDKLVRKAKWKNCILCKKEFIESSLPYPFFKIFGSERIIACSICLNKIGSPKDENANKDEIISYLKKIAKVVDKVPSINFGFNTEEFKELNDEKRIVVLKLLKKAPSRNRVEQVFGSWLNALVQAEILEDGTIRTGRGTRCLAKDGHVCFSLAEKTIDDLLFRMGISHKKEIYYPDSKYRADFLVNDTFIEYFGLAGNIDYDKKIEEKIKICKKKNIRLISLYPEDLVNMQELKEKILSCLKFDMT